MGMKQGLHVAVGEKIYVAWSCICCKI